MLVWPRLPGPLRAVPGPLVAVALATGLNAALGPVIGHAPRVELPGGLLSAVALLEGVAIGLAVHLAAHYVGHAAHDHLDAWARRQRATGASVVVNDPRDTL